MTDDYRDETLASFDHNSMARLGSYHNMRKAISELANETPSDVTLQEFLKAITDATLTAVYGDYCATCGTPSTTWPHRADRDGAWLTGYYLHPVCGSEWTCGWSTTVGW